jgi:small-conductance mechanosensitive channel
MAISRTVTASKGFTSVRAFGRTRLIVFLSFLTSLIVCMVLVWTTRDAMVQIQLLRAKNASENQAGNRKALVDLRPWQTIQAMAPLAVTAEETEYAHDAERLADHEVDQAFAAALRQANLQTQRRALTGEALELSKKVAQLKLLIQQDQAQVNSLTADSGKGGAQPAVDNDDLEVAKAQLGLDSDELVDAQRELDRASGDNSTQIKEELAAHEATMRQYDSKPNGDGQVAILSMKKHRTLATQIASWFSQMERYRLLQQAQQQTQNDIDALTAGHNALEAKVNASATAPAQDVTDHTTKISSIKSRSAERQIMGIYDDRIQTEQQLAAVYGKWSAQVLLQHRILMHMILRSLALIFLIAICMVLGDALVRRLTAHPTLDNRQAQTLRSVLEVSVQLLGSVFILLILFGSPQQTPTILGLATAALTIALQDFIVAFLGWFVLIGKHGIHVGDRVEIDGVNGEVTEVGLFRTSMLETGNDSGTGHLTGRRITFLNSFAIRGKYFNFSTAGQWMWDEITIGIAATQDVHATAERIHKAVLEETEETARAAKQELERGARGDSLRGLSTDSVVSLRTSSTGIDIKVQYITRASERTEMRNRLYQHLIDLLHV